MTAAFAVTSTLEILAALLLILGLIYEKKLIAFENKLARAVLRALAAKIRRHEMKKLQQIEVVHEPVAAPISYSPEPPQQEKPRRHISRDVA